MNKNLLSFYQFTVVILLISLMFLPFVKQSAFISESETFGSICNLITECRSALKFLSDSTIERGLSALGANVSSTTTRLFSIITLCYVVLLTSFANFILSLFTKDRASRNILKYSTIAMATSLLILCYLIEFNLSVGAYVTLIWTIILLGLALSFRATEDETKQERLNRIAELRRVYESNISGEYDEVKKMSREKVERLLTLQMTTEKSAHKIEILQKALSKIEVKERYKEAYNKIIALTKSELSNLTRLNNEYEIAAHKYIKEATVNKTWLSESEFERIYTRSNMSDKEIEIYDEQLRISLQAQKERAATLYLSIDKREKRARLILSGLFVVVIICGIIICV